jgi:hypothetical protein
VGYESFQATEDTAPLRVARSKTFFSKERRMEKQLDHNGSKHFGKPTLGIKPVNDILQNLWNFIAHEAVRGLDRATVHPSRQGGEGEEDVHELLGADIFAVDYT